MTRRRRTSCSSHRRLHTIALVLPARVPRAGFRVCSDAWMPALVGTAREGAPIRPLVMMYAVASGGGEPGASGVARSWL